MSGDALEQEVEDTVLVGRVEVAGRFVGKDQTSSLSDLTSGLKY